MVVDLDGFRKKNINSMIFLSTLEERENQLLVRIFVTI